MTTAEEQEAPARAWREIDIAGRACRIAGDPEDVYFRNAHNAVRTLDTLAAIGRAILPADGVVADIGANIGLSALALAPLVPRGRILAFEPVPAAAGHLRAAAAADPFANIEGIGTAVGAAPGSLAVHVGARFTAGSHVVEQAHAMGAQLSTIAVPVTTLDAFVAERGLDRLDLVKIDVEGFEAEVLDGAAATLARFRPVVHLEMNSFCLMSFRDRNPRGFVEMLVDRFAHVIVFRKDGTRMRVRRGPPMHRFLHDHLLLSRGVDDLVCCMEDAWLRRMPAPAPA
jgi:FkbM family methyltransferase